MVQKESGIYSRRGAEHMLTRHPTLETNMRAKLLIWMMEVAFVYELQRETFQLGCDFLDRFLSSSYDCQKTRLQLIGVTCLFIGAKLEEINPPRLQQFAFVTGTVAEVQIIPVPVYW